MTFRKIIVVYLKQQLDFVGFSAEVNILKSGGI
jgi:hypothetical protein